jgi:hypothetical protein
MGHPAERPPSVWISQVLLLLSSLPLSVGLLGSLVRCLPPAQWLHCASPLTLPELVPGVAFLACALVAFRGLQTRRRYGQRLAAALLAGSMVVGILDSSLPGVLRAVTISSARGGGTLPDPQQAWTILASLVPPLLAGFLAFRLLFSEAARRFFHPASR